MSKSFKVTDAPITPQLFGNAGVEHMRRYGTKAEHFAKIAHKNHKHSVNNPYAQFQKEYTLQEIQNSPHVHEFLTRLQCSPTSDGSAAVIVASENFVRRHHLEMNAIEIVGMEMATDPPSSFQSGNMLIYANNQNQARAYRPMDLQFYRHADIQTINIQTFGPTYIILDCFLSI